MDEIVAYRVLQAGPATSACLSLGAQRCAMSFADAKGAHSGEVLDTLEDIRQKVAREVGENSVKKTAQDIEEAIDDAETLTRM